ncbi:hypothetical protein KAH43_07065 [Candidatus Bipolaricaulota bacterium]|nr:hypothetical protein [Candidatus Bipolaricaulota bacterium]
MRSVRGVVLAVILIASAISVCSQDLEWLAMGVAPTSGGYGAAVVGTGTYIYMVKCGNATSPVVFYRFDPVAGSGGWQELSTEGLEDGAFRNGTALAWDGDGSLFALGGARYESDPDRREFFRYDIGSDMWYELDPTLVAQGAGNALVWSGFDSMIYGLIGSRSHNDWTSQFDRYDVVSDEWTTLEPPWENTDDGASLAWTGDHYIYAFRGEYIEDTPSLEFARYSISEGKWEEMASFPGEGGIGDGGSLLWVGQWLPAQADVLYALSGGSADEDPGYGVFAYSISNNTWDKLSDVPCPTGYYVGNRLGYAAGMIYYWQGSPQSARWICGGDSFFAAQISYPTTVSSP